MVVPGADIAVQWNSHKNLFLKLVISMPLHISIIKINDSKK